jgi:molybdenum cofactor cytidylyltransferase
MSRFQTVAELFDVMPVQWNLRGDPYLWKEMQTYFQSTPLPPSVAGLEQQIAQAFLILTGQPLSASEPFYIEKYAHGGMSSGYISPKFWNEQILPLLCASYAEAG